jgi:hypothetical protein
MPEEMKARLRETLLRALKFELEAKPEPGAAPYPRIRNPNSPGLPTVATPAASQAGSL